MSSHSAGRPRVTTRTFLEAKSARRPLVMITAYDFNSARLVDEAGVDAILVGDSLGMVMLGFDSTVPVTIDDMVRHTAAVVRGSSSAMVVADMPFLTLHTGVEKAVEYAGRLMVEGGAGAVKVEGASPHILAAIERMVDAGIPVMGHVGLTPQSVHALGGFRMQGTTGDAAMRIISECEALQNVGAFSITLECIPTELATAISRHLAIPTIGIGAGAGCDGQVQVFHDLLGLGTFTPKHARRFASVGDEIIKAVGAYAMEVRDGMFPGIEQSTPAKDEVVHVASKLSDAGETE